VTQLPATPAPAPATPQTPSGAKWPVIIIGLLLLNVTVCAVTVTLSLRNPAAVEPDYYNKAMNWDEHRAASTATASTAAAATEDEDAD
jgi:hypothetical protein